MVSEWQRDPKLAKLLPEARGYNCTTSHYFLWRLCTCTSALLKSRFFSSFSSALFCGCILMALSWTNFSVFLLLQQWTFLDFFGSCSLKFYRFFFFLHMSCASFCSPLLLVLDTFCSIWIKLVPMVCITIFRGQSFSHPFCGQSSLTCHAVFF